MEMYEKEDLGGWGGGEGPVARPSIGALWGVFYLPMVITICFRGGWRGSEVGDISLCVFLNPAQSFYLFFIRPFCAPSIMCFDDCPQA